MISHYMAMVDQGAVGLPITAFVRLTMVSHTPEVAETVETTLRGIPEVTEAYLLAGDDDYLAKIVVADFKAYEDLLKREIRSIPALGSIKTTFAFAVTKPPSPLPIPEP